MKRVFQFAPQKLPEGWYVYWAWDRDLLEILYVGKTSHPAVRAGQHMEQSVWADEAGLIEFYRCDSEAEATLAELTLIQYVDPVENVMRHRPDPDSAAAWWEMFGLSDGAHRLKARGLREALA